ncbi:MAG: GNAT family N-acetyltransferase [Mycobacteriaceae bacterium]
MQADRDTLVRWALQAVPGRGRRYDVDGAVAVTAAGLNRRDRLVVAGTPAGAQRVVEQALADSPRHFVLGGTELIHALRGVTPVSTFGWMDLHREDPHPCVDTSRVRRLDDETAARVLARANPGSWVQVGEPAVHAWAGVAPVRAEQSGCADHLGTTSIASLAALAHCSAHVAFIAGVGTVPEHRGQGLSRTVCAYLRDEGLRRWGTVALMVDANNAAGIALYTRLGFTYRSVTAARAV